MSSFSFILTSMLGLEPALLPSQTLNPRLRSAVLYSLVGREISDQAEAIRSDERRALFRLHWGRNPSGQQDC